MLEQAKLDQSPQADRPEFAILRLNAGGFAVHAAIRPGRPICVYGFRSEAEANAWIKWTKARLAK
jgi:hypothetical protein